VSAYYDRAGNPISYAEWSRLWRRGVESGLDHQWGNGQRATHTGRGRPPADEFERALVERATEDVW
jgi:hypothetical protein